jgi:hypothetical protein
MISHQPRRFIGPPDWLHPQWGTDAHQPPATSEPPTSEHRVRTRMTPLMFAICSCEYRGPIVVEGCQCANVCWLGKGLRHEGETYGRAKLHDCGECMTHRQPAN